MESHEFSPHLRASLFNTLMEQHRQQGDWDKVFQLLNQGQQAARSAQLQEVAEKLEEGQELVMQGLRNSGRFLEWELAILEVGLATGNIAESYRRLRDHYLLQERFSAEVKQQCRWPLVLVLVTLAGMYGWLALDKILAPGVAAAVCLAAMLLTVALLKGASQVIVKALAGAAPVSLSRSLGSIPLVGGVLRAGQLHHFFQNLMQSTEAQLALPQSLQMAAEKTPDPQFHSEFLAVYNQVEKGDKLSAALAQSQLLKGVELAPLTGAKAGASEAMKHITESVYSDYVQRLWLLARSIPQLAFLALLLIAFAQLMAL